MNPLVKSGDQRSAKKEKIKRGETCAGQFLVEHETENMRHTFKKRVINNSSVFFFVWMLCNTTS